LTVDLPGFEKALEEQRQRSRDARSAGRSDAGGPAALTGDPGGWREVGEGRQEFVGYRTDHAATEILAFRQTGERVEVILRENPFYAESGGQVSDTGDLGGQGWTMLIDSVRKDPRGTVVGGPFGERFEPSAVEARVDTARRREIERNHSATHLAHYALRQHLGTHVRQQGSLVEPGRLRFDFSHHGPIEPATLESIEREVNGLALENFEVDTREMAYPEALRLGAMAFFSEKYGERVRVVTMGPSIELCGGTHVRTTGQVGLFRFAGQGGVAAGVRRIEATTGFESLQSVERLQQRLTEAAESLKTHPDHLLRKIEQLVEERARLEARLAEMLKGGGGAALPRGQQVVINGVSLTIAEISSEDRNEIGTLADGFRQGKSKAVLVLFGTAGRGAVHVAVSDDLVKAGRKAGDLANRIAAVSGGKGGGRPQFASAGAGDPAKLPAAREATPALVAAWLTNGEQ
jgi:alanyl-tRNA synthetase